MFDPNDFEGSDSERIAAAVDAAAGSADDRRVMISKRHSEAEPDRDFWLIDEAVRLPGNIEVVVNDCRIKLPTAAGTISSVPPTAARGSNGWKPCGGSG